MHILITTVIVDIVILEDTPLQFHNDAATSQPATDYMRISDADEGSEHQQRLSILWYEMAGGKEEDERWLNKKTC